MESEGRGLAGQACGSHCHTWEMRAPLGNPPLCTMLPACIWSLPTPNLHGLNLFRPCWSTPHKCGLQRPVASSEEGWMLTLSKVLPPWGLNVPIAQQQSWMKVAACKCFTAADCLVPKGIVYSRSTCQAVQIELPGFCGVEGAAPPAPAPRSCLSFGP